MLSRIPPAPGISRAPYWKQASERYEVLRTLGRGAQGIVYLVRDRDLGIDGIAKVALDPDAWVDIRNEAGVLWALEGIRGVPTLMEAGRDFVVSEFIDGAPLDKVVFDGVPLTLTQKICLIRDLASTLDKIHARKIVHADLKPENVIATDGWLVVIDFGLAFEEGDLPYPSGEFVGTPEYAPPEQREGWWSIVGRAADIYALGVIAYEMLTGELPDLAHRNPERRNKAVPAPVDQLVARMLEPSPRNRPTASTVKRLLASHARECPWVRHA